MQQDTPQLVQLFLDHLLALYTLQRLSLLSLRRKLLGIFNLVVYLAVQVLLTLGDCL